MSYKEANDVLNYWFGGGDRLKRPRWFGGGEEATQEIRDKFETLVSEYILVVTAAHRGHAAVLKVAAIFINFCFKFKSCCNFR